MVSGSTVFAAPDAERNEWDFLLFPLDQMCIMTYAMLTSRFLFGSPHGHEGYLPARAVLDIGPKAREMFSEPRKNANLPT
jgi:hypothetical protein